MSPIQFILALAIAGALILKGELAYGTVAVEIKPVTTAVSIVPGVTGFGGGIEVGVSDHWSGFAELQHVDARLSDEQIEHLQADDDGPTDAIASRAYGTLGSLGMRYYGKPHEGSWYAAMKLLSGVESARWNYGNERLSDSQTKNGLGVDVGYRWLWDSGLLVRLGAGFTGMSTRQREIEAESIAGARFGEAETAVLELAPSDKATIRTALDFGVGYTF
jgi:hypothetical protein